MFEITWGFQRNLIHNAEMWLRDLDKVAFEIHIKFKKDPYKKLYKIMKWIF